MAPLIDLTLTLSDGMRGVSFKTARTLEKNGWNAKDLTLYSHCGTHMDAPIHFGVGPGTIDKLPLERCMGPAWVVDPPAVRPGMKLTVDDLGDMAGRVKPGDGLLIRTGWCHRVDTPDYRDALPGISRDLAQWCVDSGIAILGVEPPSVADVNDPEELIAVHTILLGGGITIVEGLANLSALTREKVFFMAFPLKIAQGDGAPARAMAREDGHEEAHG